MRAGQYVSLCVTDTGTGMTPDVDRHAPSIRSSPPSRWARDRAGPVDDLWLRPAIGRSGADLFGGRRGHDDVPVPAALSWRRGQRGDRISRVRALPGWQAGETVLVVDDEPSVRMLITEVLEEMGYTVIEAADVAAGLKVLQSKSGIDLLVTDVGLPGGMNGRQMADAARIRLDRA